MGRRTVGFYKKHGRTRPITGRNPQGMTTDQLRRRVAKLQQKGLATKVRGLKRAIPEASTRFQLELELAARKELTMKKKQLKRKGRTFLLREFRKLRL